MALRTSKLPLAGSCVRELYSRSSCGTMLDMAAVGQPWVRHKSLSRLWARFSGPRGVEHRGASPSGHHAYVNLESSNYLGPNRVSMSNRLRLLEQRLHDDPGICYDATCATPLKWILTSPEFLNETCGVVLLYV